MVNKAVTIDTPEGINFARLLALRGMLMLEMRGFTRRGTSASVIVKEMFDMAPHARRATALARLEKEIEAIRKKEPVESRTPPEVRQAFELIMRGNPKINLGDLGVDMTPERLEALIEGDGVLELGNVTAPKEVWRDIWEIVRKGGE